MTKSTLIAGTVLGILFAATANATIILPNDDTYLDQTASSTVRDAPTDANGGLVLKGQTGSQRIGLVEFTLPNVDVTAASFNFLHIRSWAAGTSWVLQVSGKQASFDETTMTWGTASGISTGTTNIGGPLTMSGGTSGQDVLPWAWKNVDLTSFFNANKGATVVLVLKNTDNSSSKGGTLEDREGTRTGNAANSPYVEFTAVPEPTTAIFLALASLGLLRRRTA